MLCENHIKTSSFFRPFSGVSVCVLISCITFFHLFLFCSFLGVLVLVCQDSWVVLTFLQENSVVTSRPRPDQFLQCLVLFEVKSVTGMMWWWLRKIYMEGQKCEKSSPPHSYLVFGDPSQFYRWNMICTWYRFKKSYKLPILLYKVSS